jgi:hypothetical protein
LGVNPIGRFFPSAGGAIVMGSTTAGNASATIWIISGGLCYRFSFFFGVYVKNNEALHATIKDL